MRQKIRIWMAFIIAPLLLNAADDNSSKVYYSANYVCDFGRNFYGGIQKGNFGLGQINLVMEIPTFQNSGFYFQMQNTHGSMPAANLVGDLQCFSNIENGDHTYLYMAYYKQSFGNFSAKLGIQDLNADFFVSELGLNFINSSFGILPTTSMNMPVSIFPKNALGMAFQYCIDNRFLIQSSLYDGDPGSFVDDPYNTKPSVDFKKQGLFSASEIQVLKNSGDARKGSYKIGFQYHSKNFENYVDSCSTKGNYGVYFIADQYFSKNIGIFTQLGWSPSRINPCTLYAGLGAAFIGHGKRIDDRMGIAIAHIMLSPEYAQYILNISGGHETVFELMYRFQLSKSLSIQPDIQYILRPGATSKGSESLIRFIRININI